VNCSVKVKNPVGTETATCNKRFGSSLTFYLPLNISELLRIWFKVNRNNSTQHAPSALLLKLACALLCKSRRPCKDCEGHQNDRKGDRPYGENGRGLSSDIYWVTEFDRIEQ
jgi:hypothetical protein